MLRTEQSPRRKPQRLPHYDYTSAGAYFVTICVKDRSSILGRVIGEEVEMSNVGKIVSKAWFALPSHYKSIELDEFIVMPNHVHGIIWILSTSSNEGSAGEGLRPSPTKSNPDLPEIVRAFKAFSAREVNKVIKSSGAFWQRGFYEHIIRNDDDLYQHRSYVANNALKWAADEYYI